MLSNEIGDKAFRAGNVKFKIKSWRTWPYWVRGGVTGFLYGMVGSMSFFLYPTIFESIFYNIFFEKPLYFIYGVYLSITGQYDELGIGAFLMSPLVYFLYGAIIGWLYGEIKSHKFSSLNSTH